MPETDVYDVPATMQMFNGPGGNSIAVYVEAQNPVLISLAFSATLKRVTGRYGYTMTVVMPDSLQEINDGWFLEIRRFRATVGATFPDRRGGRRRGYIEAIRCPANGSLPIAASFEFLRESAPTSTSSTISCRP